MELDRRGQLWTPEEVQALRERFHDGMPLAWLVERFRRTPYAITGKLEQLGLIVNRGRAYHRVVEEPWVLVSVVRELQGGQR